MAFCVTCGNQMKEGAAFCGKCGAGSPAKVAAAGGGRHTVRRIVGGIFALIVLLIIIGALVGPKQESPNQQSAGGAPAAPAKPDFKVSAAELCRQYEANSIAADLKYKGKLLEVSGEIKDINKDIVNTIYVVLDSRNPESITDAQLYFSDAYEKEAASLSKGEYFAAICRCDGKFMNVMLKDCEMTGRERH
jgi:putative nucleic acid binding protein/zinc ribbon protein